MSRALIAVMACCIPALLLADGTRAENVCSTPSFSSPSHSPKWLVDLLGGQSAVTRGMVSGQFSKRAGDENCTGDIPTIGDSCAHDIALAAEAPLENPTQDSLIILPGEKHGTFLDAINIKIEKHPRAITAGRFSGSGAATLDSIAVVSQESEQRMLLNLYVPKERSGSIQYERSELGAWELSGKVRSSGLAIGHFNRDEHLDIAVAGGNKLSILFGEASGGFRVQTIDLPAAAEGMSVAAGAFTGAATTDLAVGMEIGSGTARHTAVIVAKWEDGIGAMTTTDPIVIGEEGTSDILVKAIDLGRPDFAKDLVAAYTKPGGEVKNGALRVLMGSTGALGPPGIETPIEGTPRSLATARIDADKIPDLIVSTFGVSRSPGKVQIFRGQNAPGTSGFSFWMNVNVNANVHARALAAIKLPSSADTRSNGTVIAAADENSVHFLAGGSDGAFNEPPAIVTSVPLDVKLMTGGRVLARDPSAGSTTLPLVDLVGARKLPGTDKQVLSVWLATGTGSFGEPLDHSEPLPPTIIGKNPEFMALGKLNSDDIPDLVVIDTAPGAVAKLLPFKGLGDGAFAALGAVEQILLQVKPIAVFIAPFVSQGDANPADIAVVSDGDITIWINDGAGGFRKGPVTHLGFQPRQIIVTNRLRSSHKYDFVISNDQMRLQRTSRGELKNLRSFTTWFNNGVGEFTLGDNFEGDSSLDFIAVADTNFDGFDDVVTVGSRKLQPPPLFGSPSVEKIELNRVKVYVNDRLDGLRSDVEETSPYDSDTCKIPTTDPCVLCHAFTLRSFTPMQFGPRKLLLASFVTNQPPDATFSFPVRIATVTGDGQGRFPTATCAKPVLPIDLPNIHGSIDTFTVDRPPSLDPQTDFAIDAAFSGYFRNSSQGNSFPELAARGMLATTEFKENACPGFVEPPFVPPIRADTCEDIREIPCDTPGCGPHTKTVTVQISSDFLDCRPGTIPSCRSAMEGSHCPELNKCFCAPTEPHPTVKACQTGRRYGPLLFTFASCMGGS